MAAVQAQPYGRRSTSATLTVPPTLPPVTIDEAFAALSRNFMAGWVRLITTERDTITSGRFQVEVRVRTERVDGAAAPLRPAARRPEPAPAAAR